MAKEPEQRLKGTRAEIVAAMRKEIKLRAILGVTIVEGQREHRLDITHEVPGKRSQTFNADIRGAVAMGFYDWLAHTLRAVGIGETEWLNGTRDYGPKEDRDGER